MSWSDRLISGAAVVLLTVGVFLRDNDALTQGMVAASYFLLKREIVRRSRDYFAGQALAGGLAYCGDGQRGSWHNNASPEGVAEMCYGYADAMIVEREK